jgi:enamine deaminase RidA (YjgF/YER057c/UK114 family)
MAPIQRIRPEGLVSSPAFSHVAIVPPGATTIYVGGQNAVDVDGSLVGAGDVAAQSARALENARTALAAAGATLGDVVHWTVSSSTASTSQWGTGRSHWHSHPMNRPW